MKTILIEIPKDSDEYKFKYFPAVSKTIMKAFYESRKEKGIDTDTVINSKDFEAYTYAHTNLDHSIDFCKCKFRVEMPPANTFMIDVNYVKRLKKVVDKRAKEYRDRTRGLIIFPVMKEKRIYMINVDKIDESLKDTQFVNDTYEVSNIKREGEYYYIPKQSMIAINMPQEINFYSNEKEENRIIEKKYEAVSNRLI